MDVLKSHFFLASCYFLMRIVQKKDEKRIITIKNNNQ